MQVRKVLKQIDIKPYKTQLITELSEDKFDQRLEFFEVLMNRNKHEEQTDT